MKNLLSKLNKAFENRIRLGIMSILMVNESIDFNNLKRTLDTSDGNLASHLKALEKELYIIHKKQFIGRKPNTSYSITEKGKTAFKTHLNALESFINK